MRLGLFGVSPMDLPPIRLLSAGALNIIAVPQRFWM
jgi:hypothetical protein